MGPSLYPTPMDSVQWELCQDYELGTLARGCQA